MSFTEDIARDGFAIVPDVLHETATNRFIALMESLGVEHGRRNVLTDLDEVRAVACSTNLRSLVATILGAQAFVVRGLFFDKSSGANWMVDWHQDRTIAVRERRSVTSFDLWTVKAGVPYVQPPVNILEQMLTVRLHLDDTDERNGALRIIGGSHRVGFIPEDAIEGWVQTHQPTTCRVPRGGTVVMRPLLLHASSRSTQAGHRRVLHLEFAAAELPEGLEWYYFTPAT